MAMSGGKVCVFGYLLAALFIYAAAGPVTDPIEVKALRAIKGAFKDPMKHLQSWDKGDPCSSNWLGVWCFESIGSDGYVHVQQLQMLNLNLSESLSPEVGRLSQLEVIDLMWNNISGSIPKEIGNISSLKLLLLNGNQFTGSLPDEIGRLTNLWRLQLDENQLSGVIPKSFANLTNLRHLHLNNNSLSGQIPPELSRLPEILHLLVDNNNLSGYLPTEFSETPNLRILQLDNNRFADAEIPASYGSAKKLLKLSLRNCSLRGVVPDLSGSPELFVVDLSWNQLTGSLPSSKLSGSMTTIDLSNNNLNGSIPANFSELPNLQRLSLWNNSLSGSVPSTLWRNINFSSAAELMLDFRNNLFSNTSGDINPPKNVTLRLQENPLCNNANTNLVQFCGSVAEDDDMRRNLSISSPNCALGKCPADYYLVYSPPSSPEQCFCAAPFSIAYRLKSPSFSYFAPYESSFVEYMAESLNMEISQISVYSYGWDEGPRLWMNLTLFLLYDNSSIKLNKTEVRRIKGKFTTWSFPQSDTFGPYDLLDYPDRHFRDSSKVWLSKGALAGTILGTIAISILATAIIAIFIVRKRYNSFDFRARKHLSARISIKVDGLKSFTLKELVHATENFNSLVIGEGGYGKVYRGILADQTIVAVKRAQVGSLQGEKEFLTEIEFLSRLHHRNLVGLLGYCDDEGEQILVYEFMANGSLRDWLCGNPIIPFASKGTLSFSMRLRISLGAAKGILYLHTEANPPIFHRDIKASNILLDSRLTAKVADFGLSRLAPVADDEGDLPGHISTVVRGTPGYLDPEYFLTHKLTDKSDVYSLGVVFLELLTGMRPISGGKNIVREVNVAHKAGNIFLIVDARMGCYPSEVLAEFITLALRCCEDRPEARPSMSEVVRDLEKMLSMVQESSNTISELESDFSDRSILPRSSSSTVCEPRSQNLSSSDIYGSDLVSGVIPNITPR